MAEVNVELVASRPTGSESWPRFATVEPWDPPARKQALWDAEDRLP